MKRTKNMFSFLHSHAAASAPSNYRHALHNILPTKASFFKANNILLIERDAPRHADQNRKSVLNSGCFLLVFLLLAIYRAFSWDVITWSDEHSAVWPRLPRSDTELDRSRMSRWVVCRYWYPKCGMPSDEIVDRQKRLFTRPQLEQQWGSIVLADMQVEWVRKQDVHCA